MMNTRMNLSRIVRRRLEVLAHDMPPDIADLLNCEARAMSAVVDEVLRSQHDRPFEHLRRSRDNWRRLALMFATFTLALAVIAAVRWFQ
jgi:hypothetical protein